MPIGYIKRINLERQHGYIAVNNGGDLWFHVDALADLAANGNLEQLEQLPVAFDIESGSQGRPKAVRVRQLAR